MEKALRYELTQSIPELANQIYPTNAPEGATKPYLVYARISTKKTKVLDGFNGNQEITYMYSVMATRYADMVALRDKIEVMLMTLPRKLIGETKSIQVDDIDINNIDEQYEHELGVNRGIIDFTIYF